jgi:hypothetical protein
VNSGEDARQSWQREKRFWLSKSKKKKKKRNRSVTAIAKERKQLEVARELASYNFEARPSTPEAEGLKQPSYGGSINHRARRGGGLVERT